MTIAEYLVAVRSRVARIPAGGFLLSFETFRALDEIAKAEADLTLMSRGIELLDSFAPHPWTFFLWLDGAREAVINGVWMVWEYRSDRTKPEVLALIGKAAQQAWLAENGEPA